MRLTQVLNWKTNSTISAYFRRQIIKRMSILNLGNVSSHKANSTKQSTTCALPCTRKYSQWIRIWFRNPAFKMSSYNTEQRFNHALYSQMMDLFVSQGTRGSRQVLARRMLLYMISIASFHKTIKGTIVPNKETI